MGLTPFKWLNARMKNLWVITDIERKAFNKYFSVDWDIESIYMMWNHEANDEGPGGGTKPFRWLNDRMIDRWFITVEDQKAFNKVFGFDNTIEEITAMWHCEANEGGPAHFDWTYIFAKPLADDKSMGL